MRALICPRCGAELDKLYRQVRAHHVRKGVITKVLSGWGCLPCKVIVQCRQLRKGVWKRSKPASVAPAEYKTKKYRANGIWGHFL